MTDDIVPSDLKNERCTALPGQKCLGVGSWGTKGPCAVLLGRMRVFVSEAHIRTRGLARTKGKRRPRTGTSNLCPTSSQNSKTLLCFYFFYIKKEKNLRCAPPKDSIKAVLIVYFKSNPRSLDNIVNDKI